MSMIKRGDCVKVDFISESASEFSGKHFTDQDMTLKAIKTVIDRVGES